MISSVGEDKRSGHCPTLLMESHISPVLTVGDLEAPNKSLLAQTP